MNTSLIIAGRKSKYELIDYFKGFSILTIVLMHLMQNYITILPQFIKSASSIGGSGVHLFLLCSGFGLYYSYLKKKINFEEFIKRRFAKIYVPYIVIVFVSSLFPFMYWYSDRTVALLSHVFLFKMFVPKYEASFGGQLWYMSTIIQFYFAFIPLCKIKNQIGLKRFLILSFGISILWWFWVAVLGLENERIWNSFFLQYLWEFSLGMCIADYLYHGFDIVIKTKYLIPVSILGLVITAIAVFEGGVFRVFNDVTSLVGYSGIALIVYMMHYLEPVKNIIIKISTFSYEWYLVHILVFSCVFYIFSPTELIPQFVVGVLSFICSIAVAYGYRKIIQQIGSYMAVLHTNIL